MAAAGKSKDTKPKSKENGALVKLYMIGYNVAQVLGWTYLLFQIIGHYIFPSDTTLYEKVELPLIIFQNAALLEVLHVALGFVKSNLFLTFIQIISRVIVVVPVLIGTPTGPQSPGLPLCLLAWTITEIIRYSFYAINLVSSVPQFVIWCRYSFFLVLYPVGITGELLCMYYAQSYYGETGKWSLELPNKHNISLFNMQYFLLFIMILYIPLFPQMYGHMLSQRKKVLGGDSQEKSAKKVK